MPRFVTSSLETFLTRHQNHHKVLGELASRLKPWLLTYFTLFTSNAMPSAWGRYHG